MEFNTVIIAVNSVFKRTHFIPTHTMVTVEDAAKFSLHHTWKLYSLSNYIVSDWGLQFIALFTKELYWLLGIEIVSSTA